MKKITAILCLLLVGALLLTGCKNKNNRQDDSPENPEENDYSNTTSDSGSVSNPFSSGSASYDPSAPHGKKAVCGSAWEGVIYDRRESLNSWGNFYFGWDMAWLLCYDRTGETPTTIPCFDPLCTHFVDTCPAFYQFDDFVRPEGGTNTYPFYIFLDYYDNASSPVFYSVYRRSSVGHLGTENFDQKPYYLIQRYDFASGERVTLQSEITELIHSVYTYGDNLYYTISEDYLAKKKLTPDDGVSFTLCMLPKAGGQPKLLQDKDTKSLDILDITDDGVYYLVNSRYIYHCSLTLENPELLLDVDSITDENGNHVQLASVRDGYVFYFGDIKDTDSSFTGAYVGNCYRAPLHDAADAVKIAENMLCTASWSVFTENYLYYMPAIMESVTEEEIQNGYYHTNHSDGTVKAVNLLTGETVICCEDTGIGLFTGFVLDDDCITVYGQAYEAKGMELGTGYKHIRLYPDGREAEFWFDISKKGSDFVIGSWNE